jgi:DNA-binding transcriptional LysR family regulator
MTPKLNDIDVKLLRVFAALVEAGGFAAAQAQLNVSPSRISTQIADLEARLGMRLCQRGRVGFRLTDKGRAVYEASQRLFAGLEDFRAEVGAMRGRLVGELQIGVVDNTISNPDSRLDDAIARFRGRDNDVHIVMHIAAPSELERAVLDGRLHAAIGAFHHHAAGLAYERLFVEEQTLYCGRRHPLFARPPETLTRADVAAAALCPSRLHGGTKAKRPATFRPAATAYHMEALAVLVLSGRYIGYLPTHYAAPWVERGHMRPLLPRDLAYHSLFEVTTRKGTHRILVVRAFLDDLRRAHRDVPPRDRGSVPPG